MGWTSYHVDKINRKAECDKLWEQDEHDGYPELRVLKSTMKGSTYYAAVKNVTKGITFGVVVLTSVDNKDYYNFAYKEMDETVGPFEDKCPESIIKLLSPTDNEYANTWRKRCLENAKKVSPGSLPIGTHIRFKFSNGKEYEAVKNEPRFQFKRAWWGICGTSQYIASKHIPTEFEIVK